MEVFYLDDDSNFTKVMVKESVMVLGFFDGVHLAHRQLIKFAKFKALEKGIDLSVMTFYPHPRSIVGNDDVVNKYITPINDKVELLANLGVDRLYIVKFNSEFSKLSAETFIQKYIVGLNVVHVIVGYDYRFGHKGEGDTDTLQEKAKQKKFEVSIIDKISKNGQKIGSTQIRKLISKGYVSRVPELLGDYYTMKVRTENQIVSNKNICLQIIALDNNYLFPTIGTYLVQLVQGNTIYYGICTQPHENFHSNQSNLYMNIYLFNPSKVAIDFEKSFRMKWLSKLSRGIQHPIKSIDMEVKKALKGVR